MTIHDQPQHEKARPRHPPGDPILASKITAPDVPAWTVQRPRITELIARGARWFPLTVITGPPGAGKTMTLALWAAAEPGTVAWVNVDEYDNRPGVFWSYAVAALRRSGVAIPQPGAVWERADDHVFVLRLAAALAVAAQVIDRARSGQPIPRWLDQQLSVVQSRAYAAAGDIQAALAAAGRAGAEDSPEAAAARAHAWAAAGDSEAAARALAPAVAARGVPDRVRLYAWLTDARLGYTSGDRAHGHRSLAAALRLAEPEQLRLRFVLERSWISPVLRQDHELAEAHRRLFTAPGHAQSPAPAIDPDQAPVLPAEPLSDREREVLRHISGMLSTAEVASEMYISVNTVKTHLRTIYRKLAATHRGEAVRRARQLELI